MITSTGPVILNSISATGPVTVQGTYIVKGNGQSQGMVTPNVYLDATGTAEYQGAVTFADAGASTTIAGGSGGSDGVSLPQSTIHVASTAGFPTSGMLSITIGVNIVSVTYHGLGTDGTSFLNCLGGGGKLAAGDVVAGTSPNTTITSGASLTQSTPITIDVASTAGFASKGTILVTTSGGNTVEVNYTGTTGGVGIQASFTGCTGSGTLAVGDSVVTGDTLTLPAGQNWTSYGFSDGTAMAGASIVVSGAAVTANDSTFTVASVSGRTLTLQQSYVVDPETEPVVTVGDGMIGLAGNAGNPTSNGIDLSEVGSFIAQTAYGNIYLALGGTIDSRATSVIAGGIGNVSLTSAANFLTIENITANGATPSGASNVVGGNVGVDMNSGSLLEYPPNGSFTGTVTINNAAGDGSATQNLSSLTGTDWAAAGFGPGDVAVSFDLAKVYRGGRRNGVICILHQGMSEITPLNEQGSSPYSGSAKSPPKETSHAYLSTYHSRILVPRAFPLAACRDGRCGRELWQFRPSLSACLCRTARHPSRYLQLLDASSLSCRYRPR